MVNDRLYRNERDKIFIPINVEGSSKETTSSFWNTYKTFYSACVFAMLIGVIFFLREAPIHIKLGGIFGYLFAISFLVRVFIFEEGYYKKVYKRLEQYKEATGGIAWGIVYEDVRENGTVVSFIDGYIGCFVRMVKGSKVGQLDTFETAHRENMAEFYHQLNLKNYRCMYIDTMDTAGSDKRLDELARFIKKERNPNIRELLELSLGYMRNIAESYFIDTDVMLIYTNDGTRVDDIVEDSLELGTLLCGAGYIDRIIMDENDIMNLHKSLLGLRYFNITNAKSDLFETGKKKVKEIYISKIELDNGDTIIVDERIRKNIDDVYNRIRNGEEIEDIIKEILKVKVDVVELDEENNEEPQVISGSNEETEELPMEEEKPSERKITRKIQGSIRQAQKPVVEEKPKEDEVIDF